MKPFCGVEKQLRVLALMTLRELFFQKTVSLFVILFIGFLAVSFFLASCVFGQPASWFQELFFGMVSLFLSLLAMTASISALASQGEKTMILARPLSRMTYFFGKLFGVFSLLFVMTCYAGLLFLFLTAALKIEAVLKGNQFFVLPIIVSPSLMVQALIAAWLKACIMAAATLLIAVVATSSLFTMIAASVFYIIGHVEATAQQLCLTISGEQAGMFKVLQFVACLIPDLSLFNFGAHDAMSSPATEGSFFSIMILGLLYLFFYSSLGCLLFQRQEYLRQ